MDLHLNEGMKHYIILITLLLASVISASAQSNITDDGSISNWEAGMLAGLNNDGYEIELRALYMPNPYIGVKIGLGTAGELEQVEDWDDEGWRRGHEYTIRFKFNPSMVLRTPRVINWKQQNAGFYLFAEPGIILSPGARGSRNARYCNWNVRTGINMQISEFIFMIGYGISDFSLYSGCPVGMYVPSNKFNYTTHTGFVGCAYKF